MDNRAFKGTDRRHKRVRRVRMEMRVGISSERMIQSRMIDDVHCQRMFASASRTHMR